MTRILIVFLCPVSVRSLAAQEESYLTPQEAVEVKNVPAGQIDGPHELPLAIGAA